MGIRHATPSGASSSVTNWFEAPFDADNAAPYTNLKAALIALATGDQSEPRTIILDDNAVIPSFSDNTGDAQDWIINDEFTPIIIPQASGTPSPVYTSSGVPAGITIILPTSIQIGAITGAPTSAASGTITITATNSEGSATWTIAYNTALDVEAPDFASITGEAKTWISETAIVNVVVPRASGTPTPVYSVVGSFPAGLTFNPSNRTISGTPTSPGSGTITIRATNSEGSVDWTFDYKVVGALSISVTAGNPIASVDLLDPCIPGVNTQTVVLKGSWYSTVINIVKQYIPIAADGRPKIDSCLVPPNTNLYFQSFSIFRSGQITISFADHLTSGGLGGEGHDLSDTFESGGQFILQAGPDVVTLNLAGASDKLEPYTFETNTSRFFNAISANEELTLTIRDFTPIVPNLFASASTGVPIARAALVAAVLSTSASAGVPTAQASLLPPTISIKASTDTPSASVDIISQLPFDLSWASERGRIVYVSAVITAGVPRGNGTVYEDQPGRTPLGSVLAGSDLESQTGQSVTAIALNELFTGNITFWDSPSPLAWSSFFTDNPDVSLWMQFAPRGPVYPFVARGHGGTYSAWATGDTAAQAAVTANRVEGARFAFVLRGAPATITLSASSVAGVPTARANLQQPTLSTVISAGNPTARVNLQGRLLSASASAGVPSATINIEDPGVRTYVYVPPYGYSPIVLAFLEADVSGVDITAEPTATIGTDNDLIVASNLVISQVERHVAGAQIRLRRSGDGEFSTYFDNEGSPLYPDARLQIQLSDLSIIDGSIDNTGGGFNNWSVANSAQRSKLNAIATGERFVLAILKKITIEVSASAVAPEAKVALVTPLVAGDASAGVPTAQASLLSPISLTAATSTPTVKVNLASPTLSISASAVAPTARAYLASLVLTTNDIDLTNLDVYALALINTGTPTPNGTVYEDQPNRTPVGSIDAGGDLIARPGQDITRIALNIQGSGNVRFWDNPSEQSWTNFFGTYPRATLRLQFEIPGPAYELTRGGQGSNFSNWSTTNVDARAAIASARANGKKFIFLLAEERIAVRAGEGERGSIVTAGAEGTGRKIDAATRSGSGEFGESATEGVEGTGSSRTVTSLGEGEVGRVTASATEGQGTNVVIKKVGSGEFGKIITSGKEGVGRKITLLPATGSGEFGRVSTAGREGTGRKIDLLSVVGSGEFGKVIIAGAEGAGIKIIPLPTAGSGEFGDITAAGKEGVGRKNAARTLSGTGEFGVASSGGTEGTGRRGGDLTGFVKIAEVRGISFPRTGLKGDVSYDITLRSRDRTGNTGNLVSAGTVLTEDLLDVFGAEFVFQRNNTGIVPDSPLSTELQRKTDDYIPTGWSDNPQGVNVSNRYEYISSRTGSPGRWSEYGLPGLYDIFIVEGETEAQFIFRRTTSASAPNAPLSNQLQRASDNYIPSQWVRDAQGTTEILPYEWASYRLGGNGNWSVFYPPTLREAHLTARGPIPFFRAISGSSWSNSEANLATTGNNVTGDRVTLYNTSADYTKTRVWNGSAWITIGKWIDGNLIVEGTVLSIFDIIAGAAVQSSNYRGGVAGWRIAQDGGAEFDAAAIRGILSADHIDSDVQNVVILSTSRTRFTRGSENSISCSLDIDNFDIIGGIGESNGGQDFLPFMIPRHIIPLAFSTEAILVPTGSSAIPAAVVNVRRSSSGLTLYFKGGSAIQSGWIQQVWGIKNPGGGIAPNPSGGITPPPPSATTTVSANAGPNVSVESGGSTQIGGADSITNGSGSTTYRWARRSGTGGSLSSTTIAQPTFTAPTVSSNRSIIWRKTTTNNGVSDTDDVTITVTLAATQAPGTPGTPSATTRGQNSLTLSVTPGAGGAATSYRWRYSTNSTVSNSDTIVTSTGPSITISGLGANTNYWVDVRAENSAGNSGYSENLATSTTASGADPVDPPIDPPTSSTTVSANAGSDKSIVGGGGRVRIGGNNTITNGVGRTTINWARVSGAYGINFAGGSSAASNRPYMLATAGNAERTAVWRKTVTNNGVSDTDDVTITITYTPGGGSSPATAPPLGFALSWISTVAFTGNLAQLEIDSPTIIGPSFESGLPGYVSLIEISTAGLISINFPSDLINSLEATLAISITYDGVTLTAIKGAATTSSPYSWSPTDAAAWGTMAQNMIDNLGTASIIVSA